MARPVTLFTGQWADLPLEDLAAKAGRLGLRRARARLLGRPLRGRPGRSPTRATQRRSASSSRRNPWLLGARRAPRRAGGLRPDRRAPPGRSSRPRSGATATRPASRQRAAERMKDTARAAAALRRHAGERLHRLAGLAHALLASRRTTSPRSSAATSDFAERWGPILDVFDAEGVRFGLEVHPTEIAYDFVTTRKTLDAIGRPRGVRDQLRPVATSSRSCSTRRASSRSSPTASTTCTSRTRKVRLDGRRSILGSHLNFGERRARLGLRLARPRRRRLRGALPRAQPHRLRGAAVDRVGGLGHGPRARRAGRARVRAAHATSAPSDVAFDAAMQRMSSLTGGGRARPRRGEIARDRRRHARLRLHGQGALERAPEDRRT